jgi:hypothetical protein
MIDTNARKELAACLDQLVSGEMTNDAFDDRYHGGNRSENWFHSEDGAVAEIATFGWRLYSSDTFPHRLTGPYAVSEETRQTANRAIMFLQTEREYEWPRNVQDVTSYLGLWGPGFYLLFGIILMVSALGQGGSAGLFMGGLGLLAILPTFHWLATSRKRTEDLQRFYESGDVEVWPFLRQADFERAKGPT